tara:strand:+ start:188 stop:646 length:459 start_codon:yes stop_codon:yes gene_type:complete
MAKLTVNEASGDFTHVVKLTAADIVAIGNGGQDTILTLPAGSAVDLVGVVNNVDIVGSSDLVIDVGTTTGDPDEFINALDVSAMTVNLPTFNSGDLMYQSAATTTVKNGSHPVSAVSADTAVVIEITDAAAASITAGEVIIGFRVIDLSRFF